MTKKADRLRQTRADIGRSFEEGRLVRVIRKPRAAGPVDGVVVARGIRWILINRLSPDLDLDGNTALRWKHIKKVHPFGSSSVPARATPAGAVQPIPTEVVDPTTTGTLLRSVAGPGTPIVIYTEQDDPTRRIVGTVADVVHKSLHLMALDLPDVQRCVSVDVPFDMITRVDFAGRYLTGLARAIGSAAASPGDV